MGHSTVALWLLAVCQQDLFTSFIAIISTLCFVHYTVCTISFNKGTSNKQGLKAPPLVPSLIPIIGNVSWRMIWNPRHWALNTRELFHHNQPVSAWFLAQKVYIVQGTENVQAMFRQRHPSSFVLHGFLMGRVFGLPRKALKIYQKDDSGSYPKPNSHSKVKPQNRIDHLLKTLVHRFLLGPGLQPFARRFQIDFAQRVQNLAVGNDWVEWDDFVSFYTQDLTASFLNALCGKYLLQKHPEFLTHLWTVERNIYKLVTGLPRFLFPRTYTARDECLAALKSWHTWASQNFDPADVDAAGDDPIWGSKFFRERKEVLNQVEGFDQDAIATHDLAFIWGATNNVIISAFWSAVEAFKDPKLLSLVREEAKACLLVDQQSDCLQFDIKKLQKQPYLQAIYAETLRLRIGGFLVRHQNQEDLNIEGWRIPKNHYILNNTMHGHMNPDIWSKGTCENHPVEEFWPARFLKPGADGVSQEFTMEMSKGAWMPYGGGHNTCPGRQHAKMTNIYTTALMVLSFDCEIIADPKALDMSMRNFGFGVAAPRGKIPVRIRRL